MRKFIFSLVAIAVLLGAAEWCRQLVGMITFFSEMSAPRLALRSEASFGGVSVLPRMMALPGRRAVTSLSDSSMFASAPVSADFEERARAAAERYLNERREEWKVRSYHEMHAQVFVTPLGATVKFTPFQDNLPVVGMDLELSVDRQLKVSLANSSYRPVPRVETRPEISVEEAMEKISDQFTAEGEGHGATPVIFLPAGMENAELAYVVQARDKNKRSANVTLRANDARVISVEYARTN
jgi:hypothetical protein